MASTSRSSLSKSLRFEIFKRDNFTCQYCGSHPPEIVLEVDHIVAVANGGPDDEDNLVTSCFNCNRGKAARQLSSVPKSLQSKAADISEREAQLLGYYDIIRAKRARVESEVWQVIHLFCGEVDTFRSDWFRSIQTFVERIGLYEVFEAMEIATSRFSDPDKKCFVYFCGICWRKIKEPADG